MISQKSAQWSLSIVNSVPSSFLRISTREQYEVSQVEILNNLLANKSTMENDDGADFSEFLVVREYLVDILTNKLHRRFP